VSLKIDPPRTTRRSALVMMGSAGVAGVGSVLLGRGVAGAAPASVDVPPSAPTPEDTDLLAAALGLELTAAQLYGLAVESIDDEFVRDLAANFGTYHEFYAEEIAGISGLSANYFDEVVYAELAPSFGTGDVEEFAAAAAQLEATASATHTQLVAEFASSSARTLSASIQVIEARMATVMNDLAGNGDDLDAMLTSDAEPLDLAAVPEGRDV